METVEEYLYLLLESAIAAVLIAMAVAIGNNLMKDIYSIYEQVFKDIKYMLSIIKYANII
ncbi:MAG: hypothetical protein JHC22_00280 [Thermoproteus sp.]|nr:hypothetical protein [Thermoproteus sp.]